jgi:glycosyltransferase involved in cell wall biosynthesis
MGKKSKNPQKSSNAVDKLPYVSICTPTFNRRPFIPIMFECFKNQTYPKNKMEWIIVDDGTDKIEDLVKASGITQIKYVSLPKKITLGEKRNVMHQHAKGTIIVYMDDDDYYPPERVSHSVQKLLDNPTALCAGSSEMYIYFKHINKMYQSGPFGPNHATAATFAFRVELLKQTQYENTAALAEERAFLKEYTVPFVQLDPMKTILVFSHNHNSFDKKKLLEYGESPVLKQSEKTVDMFIRQPFETSIKDFFMRDIDVLLAQYAPGDPINKPDVIKQTAEIEKKRNEMAGEGSYLVLQQPGKEPTKLSPQDVVNILQQQQTHIQTLTDALQKLETRNKDLEEQLKLMEMLVSIGNDHKKEDITVSMKPNGKSDPEVYVEM